jgi:hypothetical protein
MDPGPTISRPYTRHKWVGRMICSQASVSAHAQDLLRLPESMTIIKNRTDNLRFSFPLVSSNAERYSSSGFTANNDKTSISVDAVTIICMIDYADSRSIPYVGNISNP